MILAVLLFALSLTLQCPITFFCDAVLTFTILIMSGVPVTKKIPQKCCGDLIKGKQEK